MSFAEILENAAEAAVNNTTINEGDYIGDDGLLYCVKCNTNKQTRVTIFGKERIVYCACECRAAEIEAEKATQKQKERQSRITAMRAAAFPERALENWTFANDNGSNPKLTAAMKRYVDEFENFKKRSKGILLYGGCGTGKTYAACEVANALTDKGISVKVTNFSRILNELQGAFDKQGYLDDINSCSLLVIDDLGIERNTEFAKEQVYNVIDGRYRTGLPMIITTNLSVEEIYNPTDPENKRIYERILDRCHPILVGGTSKRIQKVHDDYEADKNLLGL